MTETEKPKKKKSSWMKGFTLPPRSKPVRGDWVPRSPKLPTNWRDI